MLQQTINNILPSGSETVDIDVHEEIIESIFQRIDDKKPQNDILFVWSYIQVYMTYRKGTLKHFL